MESFDLDLSSAESPSFSVAVENFFVGAAGCQLGVLCHLDITNRLALDDDRALHTMVL